MRRKTGIGAARCRAVLEREGVLGMGCFRIDTAGSQVLAVAKALSAAGARFRSTIITGEHKWATQRKCAENGMELIVATPGRSAAPLS